LEAEMVKNVFFAWLLIGLTLSLAGCQDKDRGQAKQTQLDAVSLAEIKVSQDDTELVYQYYNQQGEPVVVTKAEDVPEDSRENVMVLFSGPRRAKLPAKALVLADLTRTDDAGSHPFRLVNRYQFKPANYMKVDALAPQGWEMGEGIQLFTAPGCGHCVKARKWLTKEGLKFVERDVSKDQSAGAQVVALGRAQGIPEQYLSSVPILVVKGKVLVGFDPGQVKAALN
jgi:glutaredoxin 3